MLQLSSSEEVGVSSIIVDELSTRHLNLLHKKSILHFRSLVFPALAGCEGAHLIASSLSTEVSTETVLEVDCSLHGT